jgi:hypothetical protein
MPSQARALLSKLFRWFEKRKRPTGISGVRWRADGLVKGCDRGCACHMLVSGCGPISESGVISGSVADRMMPAATS